TYWLYFAFGVTMKPWLAASSSPEKMFHGGALQRDDQCHACGSYFDDEFSSGTDTEAEVDADDWSHYQTVDVDGDFKSDENAIGSQIYYDYQAAKQRWRRFTGKPPRRHRRHNLKRDQNIQKLQRSSFRSTYAAFLPRSASHVARVAPAAHRPGISFMTMEIQQLIPAALPGITYGYM
ncbi:unnamed protein product, partial [Effrenium voratum]